MVSRARHGRDAKGVSRGQGVLGAGKPPRDDYSPGSFSPEEFRHPITEQSIFVSFYLLGLNPRHPRHFIDFFPVNFIADWSG